MPDYQQLRQFGLTPLEVECYAKLYTNGTSTAGKLAWEMGKARTSVYHALAKLEKFGFVDRSKEAMFHEVTRFRAVRLDKALENLAIYQRRAAQPIIDYQIERSLRFQIGRYAVHVKQDWR